MDDKQQLQRIFQLKKSYVTESHIIRINQSNSNTVNFGSLQKLSQDQKFNQSYQVLQSSQQDEEKTLVPVCFNKFPQRHLKQNITQLLQINKKGNKEYQLITEDLKNRYQNQNILSKQKENQHCKLNIIYPKLFSENQEQEKVQQVSIQQEQLPQINQQNNELICLNQKIKQQNQKAKRDKKKKQSSSIDQQQLDPLHLLSKQFLSFHQKFSFPLSKAELYLNNIMEKQVDNILIINVVGLIQNQKNFFFEQNQKINFFSHELINQFIQSLINDFYIIFLFDNYQSCQQYAHNSIYQKPDLIYCQEQNNDKIFFFDCQNLIYKLPKKNYKNIIYFSVIDSFLLDKNNIPNISKKNLQTNQFNKNQTKVTLEQSFAYNQFPFMINPNLKIIFIQKTQNQNYNQYFIMIQKVLKQPFYIQHNNISTQIDLFNIFFNQFEQIYNRRQQQEFFLSFQRYKKKQLQNEQKKCQNQSFDQEDLINRNQNKYDELHIKIYNEYKEQNLHKIVPVFYSYINDIIQRNKKFCNIGLVQNKNFIKQIYSYGFQEKKNINQSQEIEYFQQIKQNIYIMCDQPQKKD